MLTSSAQHDFSLIPEVTYGTTPAVTPNFLKKQITGTTLGLTKGSIESKIINPNGQVTDVRHGNRQAGGELSFELIYGEFDDMMEAVLRGTWAGDVLVPGVVRRSYSMLRHFTDLPGGSLPFQLFKGVVFNTFGLSFAPEQMVQGTFGLFGAEVTYAATAPTGTTYTAASDLKPFDSFSGSLTVDGSEVATVTEMTLSVENGVEPRFRVFSDKTQLPKMGKTRVTGNLTSYFETSDLLVAFNGGDKRDLAFTLIDLEGNEYLFELPSILLNGGQPDVSEDTDITISVPFSAIYESGAANPNALRITRTDAA